jgi:hypothetical protein
MTTYLEDLKRDMRLEREAIRRAETEVEALRLRISVVRHELRARRARFERRLGSLLNHPTIRQRREWHLETYGDEFDEAMFVQGVIGQALPSETEQAVPSPQKNQATRNRRARTNPTDHTDDFEALLEAKLREIIPTRDGI